MDNLMKFFILKKKQILNLDMYIQVKIVFKIVEKKYYYFSIK